MSLATISFDFLLSSAEMCFDRTTMHYCLESCCLGYEREVTMASSISTSVLENERRGKASDLYHED